MSTVVPVGVTETDLIHNLWRYLAVDPPLLEQTWAEVKQVMATPSSLDPLTEEVPVALVLCRG